MQWLLMGIAIATWALAGYLLWLLAETRKRRPERDRSHDPSHDMTLE